MRKKTRLALIGAALAVTGSAISIPLAGVASASSPPSVTIVNMPGSSLADGGSALLTGSGFQGGHPTGIEVIECSDPGGLPANRPTDPSLGCDGSTVSANQINISSSGTFRTTYAVSSLSPPNAAITCDATHFCVLWAGVDYNNNFSDGVTEAFSAPFEVAPGVAPTISSPNSAAFPTFQTSPVPTFTVTGTGTDLPAVSESGTLPSGVTYHDNGDGTATLTGQPTVTGAFPLTFTASNGTAPNVNQSFTLYAGFQVTTTSLPGATEGAAYTGAQIAATGGTAPYKFKIKGLPKGLKGSKTGAISGTPKATKHTVLGEYSVTITVTDTKVKSSTKHPNLNAHGKETATATLMLNLSS